MIGIFQEYLVQVGEGNMTEEQFFEMALETIYREVNDIKPNVSVSIPSHLRKLPFDEVMLAYAHVKGEPLPDDIVGSVEKTLAKFKR